MLTIPQIQAAGGYGIIYKDAAWQYRDRSCRGSSDNHYHTMSDSEIYALPIKQIAAKDCALFLWATKPKLKEAFRALEAWEFEYKCIPFVWQKYYSNSCRPFYGNGRWTRANTEFVLLGTRGKPKRLDKGVGELIETIEHDPDALLQAGAAEHSAKPDEVRQRIKMLLGDHVPALEMNARERMPGWDAWGNDPGLDLPDVLLTSADIYTQAILAGGKLYSDMTRTKRHWIIYCLVNGRGDHGATDLELELVRAELRLIGVGLGLA